MDSKTVHAPSAPALLQPYPRDVVFLVDSLTEEVDELTAAVASQDPAAILDELVDVLHFVRQLADVYDITPSMLNEYATIKGRLRRAGVKNKQLESLIASRVVSESSTTEFLKL